LLSHTVRDGHADVLLIFSSGSANDRVLSNTTQWTFLNCVRQTATNEKSTTGPGDTHTDIISQSDFFVK